MISSAVPRAILRQIPKRAPKTCIRPLHTSSPRLAGIAMNPGLPVPKSQTPLSLTAYRRDLELVRRYATKPGYTPGTYQRPDKEAAFGKERLKVDPDHVTTSSSTTALFGPDDEGKAKEEDNVDMMAGIRHDIVGRPASTRQPEQSTQELGS